MIDVPARMMLPTAGRSVEVNTSPILLTAPNVTLVYSIGRSVSSVYAYPVMVRSFLPMFDMMIELSRPLSAPGPPTTSPPKSTSAGPTTRNAALLTSLPCRLMGNEFEYFGTAFVV